MLQYRIQCKIGEGSFSDVLRCQNRETGQVVAAKRLKQFFPSTAEAEEIPEVIAMKKLPHHPNILHLIESHFEPLLGKVTLIFDIMDMSIYDMIKTRKRPVPEAKVKNYLYQILKGIAHLHNHGVFHRDIKPENILIKGETIKIADLGSVRGIYSRKPYTEYISTRWYRSPECLLTSGYYGPKMDVWAAGCVFYELLTLKPLFPGSNEIDQISKIHVVLGTPSQSLLSRLKRKSQHADINFPQKAGTGFGCLLQNISEGGREILKMMLIYDPKLRSATRRLLENRYFNDLREYDLLKQRLSISQTFSSSTTEWRNPVLLSFMTSERKRKQKLTLPTLFFHSSFSTNFGTKFYLLAI
ncbi:MAPK/MAK/MRK overlapping kinase-like [Lycorma delicatula]|uniref:MAPK/MAK/MRK overlapping kinase-like n=1 Tax=Lycorma delicatula TaxID=130591 RepID=UPI003F512047